ncbi:MAG: hypothetical protein IJ613_03810 [Muribaculaceae bacterium]|nr:hypothetical protein [Muribaculaceae bacterium]
MKLYISALLLSSVALLPMASCSDDKLGDTIFPEITDELDPSAYTYKFDLWLQKNYLEPYNVNFNYKLADIDANMNYNLVPADYNKAMDLALLTKYLWFDVYDKIAGKNLLKETSPRVLQLVGSSALNPNTGSETVGLAEGGVKVTLFNVNNLNVNSFQNVNDGALHTMHHEYTHILHQKKNYPTEFNRLSVGRYDASNWSSRGDLEGGVVNSLGFVTKYASSDYREDFAETVSNFITMTDAQWNRVLELAGRGWYNFTDQFGNDNWYCYYYYTNNVANDSTKAYIDEFSIYRDASGTMFTGSYQRAVTPYVNDTTYNVDGEMVVNILDANGFRVETAGGNPTGFVLDAAGQRIPIKVYPVEDEDEINGREVILQKVNIARKWLMDDWGIDLDAVREEVQWRQRNYNLEELRQQIANMGN